MSLEAGDTPGVPSADEADYHPIDASMKALLRSHPEVLFRLAAHPLEATCLRLEDTAINLPEQRADHVFVVSNGVGREEVALITGSGAPTEEQGELLAMALRVAGRKLPRTLVETVFREELPMIQGATIVDDWIAEGEARGEARGETRGELRGRLEEARRLTRVALTIRFGALPAPFAARVEAADAEECERLFRQVMTATSLSELLA